MNLFNTGVFDLAQRRLEWADQRQLLLARNIANADTPNYRPADLQSFADTLANGSYASATQLVQTNPMHIAVEPQTDLLTQAEVKEPNGNAVSVDKELGRVADTQSAQTTALNLYSRYASFFRLAMGRAS